MRRRPAVAAVAAVAIATEIGDDMVQHRKDLLFFVLRACVSVRRAARVLLISCLLLGVAGKSPLRTSLVQMYTHDQRIPSLPGNPWVNFGSKAQKGRTIPPQAGTIPSEKRGKRGEGEKKEKGARGKKGGGLADLHVARSKIEHGGNDAN